MMSEAGSSSLAVLGFTAEQELLYRMLLRNSGSSLDRLGDMLGRSVEELREELVPFETAGLLDLGGPALVVHPPDNALGRLISAEAQRLQSVTDQLETLRNLLPSLAADMQSAQATSGDPVTIEALDSGDVAGLVRNLTLTSSGEMMWLRPDQWRLDVGREIDSWVMGLIRSGRRSRAIYPARVLEEAPEVVRARAEAGEHVRILAAVPSRVAIMGDSAVLMSEHWGSSAGRRLVIRQDAIIGAITLLFDRLWDRAMSVPGLGSEPDPGRSNDRRLLLDQLSAGAKDEQIARALGLSLRTVRRRVADILEELDADSRFQAGAEAVRRGWI